MNIKKRFLTTFIILVLSYTFSIAKDSYIPISQGVKSIKMSLNGEDFVLMRNQNKDNTINSFYSKTTLGVPQPLVLAKDVETLGELEFIEYMKKAQDDENIMIVDSRTPGWYAKLRIPGASNVPYTNFKTKDLAYETVEFEFNVIINKDKTLDFSKAKTLVIYCNGYWCGQTPAMVKNSEFSLLKLGYPPNKIKYYRGGMQAWTSLGLTVIGSNK